MSTNNVPLVEGCVDSDGEADSGDHADTESRSHDNIIDCDSDTITICDTRVRLRLCAATSVPSRRQKLNCSDQFVPVKRKDLFKLLGLNETSDILDPCEEADAKKLALQNILCAASNNKVQFNIHNFKLIPIDSD